LAGPATGDEPASLAAPLLVGAASGGHRRFPLVGSAQLEPAQLPGRSGALSASSGGVAAGEPAAHSPRPLCRKRLFAVAFGRNADAHPPPRYRAGMARRPATGVSAGGRSGAPRGGRDAGRTAGVAALRSRAAGWPDGGAAGGAERRRSSGRFSPGRSAAAGKLRYSALPHGAGPRHRPARAPIRARAASAADGLVNQKPISK